MFLARQGRIRARLAAASFSATARSLQAEPAAIPEQSSDLPDWDPPQYQRIGTISGKYAVERKPVFAVVEVGATQFKVSPDDLVYSEKLIGAYGGAQCSVSRSSGREDGCDGLSVSTSCAAT